MNQRPLFVPLKTEWYEAFAAGRKTEELRLYGTRWNERSCAIGRPVVLSKGYGKKDRLAGQIGHFYCRRGTQFSAEHQDAIRAVYGTLDVEIACIGITSLKRAS